MPPGNAFGFDDEPEPEIANDPEAAPFADVQPTGEEPELLEEDLQAQPGPTPTAVPVAQAEGSDSPASGEDTASDTAEDALTRYVGQGRRYADPGALASAYENAEVVIGRQGQQMGELSQRQVQLEGMLRQAIGMIQQQQSAAPTGPAPLDPWLIKAAEDAGLDENALRIAQSLAGQEANRRVAPIQAQLAREAAERYQREALEQTQAAQNAQGLQELEVFRMAHASEYANPEAAIHVLSPVWNALDAFPDDPLPVNARNLQIAHEASKDPSLFEVLQAVPELMDTDAGMRLARTFAQGAPAAAAPAAKPAAPALPHVEAGGTGPKPVESAADEWDVLKLVRAERNTHSPLGI